MTAELLVVPRSVLKVLRDESSLAVELAVQDITSMIKALEDEATSHTLCVIKSGRIIFSPLNQAVLTSGSL